MPAGFAMATAWSPKDRRVSRRMHRFAFVERAMVAQAGLVAVAKADERAEAGAKVPGAKAADVAAVAETRGE